MQFRRLTSRLSFLVAIVVTLCGSLHANNNNNGGGANNNNNGGGANNNNNTANPFAAGGVEIDPLGTLRVMRSDPRVTQQRMLAAKQQLPANLARASKLRKFSLNRLEAAIAKKLASGGKLDQEMITLAGLTRVEYVFFYPESGDIVLAGPAEGFAMDSNGRYVGIDSGKPTMLLEDLVIALRAYPPQGKPTNSIRVSIDPTQDGLARMQATLKQIGSNYTPDQIPNIVNALRQSLGLNEVSLEGVPRTTHFAHVLVEADYRMKLIGIGLEQPPVPMTTYVSKLASSPASSNALMRWFFVPDYNSVACSEDGTAMELVGEGLKLVGEDELVDRNGNRKVQGATSNPASKAFTVDFTRKFSQIADKSLVYGQLRNLVDLSFAAAFIQDRDLYEKSGWSLGVMGSEDQLPVETRPAPRQVETAINAVVKGTRLITPIGGGIEIQATKALKQVRGDEGGEIAKLRDAQKVNEVKADQWWWD